MKRVLYGVAMLDDMACHMAAPYITLSLNIDIFLLQLLRQNYKLAT